MPSASEHLPDGATTTTATANTTNGSSSTLLLTVHPERSRVMHLLQATLKPMRPHLVAPPKKPWPAGSNRLKPHSSAEKKCRVEAKCRQGVWTYELVPKSLSPQETRPQHNLYYFAGGSFQNVPSSAHWKTVAEISLRLGEKGKDNVRAHVVSPPLAPNSPAKDSLRILRAWIEDVLEEASREGWTICLAGDSSGGNLAATLAIGVCGGWPESVDAVAKSSTDEANQPPKGQIISNGDAARSTSSEAQADLEARLDLARAGSKVAAEEAHDGNDLLALGRSPNASSLVHILLVCPALDMRNVNDAIGAVGAVDPMLTPDFTGAVAECWRGAVAVTSHPSNWHAHTPFTSEHHERLPDVMAPSDPRVSPLLANLSVLHDCDVTVDGLIAGLDSLAPDAKEFTQKLEQAGVSGEWQLWDNMMHCWPLTWWGGLREGNKSVEWMIERVRTCGYKKAHTVQNST